MTSNNNINPTIIYVTRADMSLIAVQITTYEVARFHLMLHNATFQVMKIH